MTPVTNPNVTIGLYAFRPIAGPLYYIPQAWTRAVLDLTVGSLVPIKRDTPFDGPEIHRGP